MLYALLGRFQRPCIYIVQVFVPAIFHYANHDWASDCSFGCVLDRCVYVAGWLSPLYACMPA